MTRREVIRWTWAALIAVGMVAHAQAADRTVTLYEVFDIEVPTALAPFQVDVAPDLFRQIPKNGCGCVAFQAIGVGTGVIVITSQPTSGPPFQLVVEVEVVGPAAMLRKGRGR